MLKKILILLFILMICGCSSRISSNTTLKDLGYSQEDIILITTYKQDDVKPLYIKYDKDLLDIIKDDRCDSTKIQEYIKYYKEFDLDILFEFVNNGYTKKSNWNTIKTLAKQDYFIIDNLELYLGYYSTINDIKHLISYVNVGCYKEPYFDLEVANTFNEMDIIANKWHYLGDYEPSDLVTIDKKDGASRVDLQLKKAAADAFIKMHEAAVKDKINIYISSAYRSYIYQVKLYGEYLAKDKVEVVDTYSSRPGHSDHQTGLAVDILSSGYTFDTFEKSPAFKWLSENAYKYGFILRYPKDKEDITGYMYESWHYRYVGEEIAKYIKDNDLTYDEYYAYFIEKEIIVEGE